MTSSTPHAPPSLTPAPGDYLTEKYRIDRVLGEGGMGVVLAATDTGLGRQVAIKFLLPQFITDAGIVARFMREARATVQIQSEHVVRVIEVGHLSDRAPYIVMEYLQGEDLADLLARGPLPVEVGIDYVLQACEAIAEAHAKGIVHRDLKPANLFLTQRPDGSPTIKVLDFGISKLRDSVSPENATQIGAAMGSPMYMSPEHATAANEVDARSDVWSLGVILYELLSGQRPHNSESLTGLMKAIMFDQARPLHEWGPHIPPQLSVVAQRCLEKDPDHRYQNVGELALALAPFAGEAEQLSVRRIVRVSGMEPLADSARPPSSGGFHFSSPDAISRVRSAAPLPSESKPGLSRRTKLGLAAIAAVLVLAGIGAALLLGEDALTVETAPAAEPPTASSTPAPAVEPATPTPEEPAQRPPEEPEPAAVTPTDVQPVAPAVREAPPAARPKAPRVSRPAEVKRPRRERAPKARPKAAPRKVKAPSEPEPAPKPRRNPLEMTLE